MTYTLRKSHTLYQSQIPSFDTELQLFKTTGGSGSRGAWVLAATFATFFESVIISK